MARRLNQKSWRVLPGDAQAEANLVRELNIHPMVARLLIQRDVVTSEVAHKFLNPSMDHLHDPMLLPDIEVGIHRIRKAIQEKEKIIIHGDYDADGVTSAALWTRALRTLGGDVEVFVPHRYRDGYDMRSGFIDYASELGAKLIITTDCGIQRIEEVEQATAMGMDVIISDHHMPGSDHVLPKAIAVINPQRRDSIYPFKGLAGVGVAFKCCEALVKLMGHNVDQFRRAFLDLATLGTVSDMMPALDENRAIIKFGLHALRDSRKPGLQALLKVSGLEEKELTASNIGFALGPRLNAASRVDETQHALDLLLTKEPEEANRLAERLNQLNFSRREETDKMMDEANELLSNMDIAEMRCLVLSKSGWRGGLVGLVAGRCLERFHRPCIVIGLDDELKHGRGSARSIPSFNILEAIDACGDLLNEYGGHHGAAGLSIKADRIEEFSRRINEFAATKLSDEDMVPTLEASLEINPEDVTDDLLEQLGSMAPFGIGNPEPRFISRGARILEMSTMSEGKHLRIMVEKERGSTEKISAPWFRNGELHDQLKDFSTLDLFYRPEFNHFRGKRSIQFMIDDVRPPEW